jgi:hypothetical protein
MMRRSTKRENRDNKNGLWKALAIFVLILKKWNCATTFLQMITKIRRSLRAKVRKKKMFTSTKTATPLI